MTTEEFRRTYEDWGVDSRLDAEVEAATVGVPGETIIVVAFPLGNGKEWTLRLASDRYRFDESVVDERHPAQGEAPDA